MSRGGADVLERAFPAPPDALDRLVRRREVKTRRRKTASAVTAVLIGGAVILAAAIALKDRAARHEPARVPISSATVSQLGLQWFGKIGASVNAPPTVAGDRVYVIGSGTIQAFAVSCSGPDCQPVWKASLPLQVSDLWWAPPMVAGNRVYAGASDGMYAFPTSCNASPCGPVWVGKTRGSATTGAPAVAAGQVFVGSGDGYMYVFPLTCSQPSGPQPSGPGTPAACAPIWKGPLPHGFLGGAPIVEGGVVYVASSDGTMEAFSVGCTPSAGMCDPLWKTKVPAPLADQMYAAAVTPLTYQNGFVYMAAGASLYAFPATCAHPPTCPPAWTAQGPSPVTGYILRSGDVYVDGFDGSTYVYSLACKKPVCQPAWTIPSFGAAALTGDVVVAAGNGMAAFKQGCGLTGPCSKLWGQGPAAVNAMGTVGGDTVYLTDADGYVFALSIGARGKLPDPRVSVVSGPAHAAWYIAFYAALFAAAVLWALRVRRRRDRNAWTDALDSQDPVG